MWWTRDRIPETWLAPLLCPTPVSLGPIPSHLPAATPAFLTFTLRLPWPAPGQSDGFLALGVSAVFLRRFLQEIETEFGATKLAELTTKEICDKVIVPKTQAQRCAYMDLIQAEDHNTSTLVAPATVFVSHAWKYTFAMLVNVVLSFEKEHPGNFYWIDLFPNNQHGADQRPHDWCVARPFLRLPTPARLPHVLSFLLQVEHDVSVGHWHDWAGAAGHVAVARPGAHDAGLVPLGDALRAGPEPRAAAHPPA
jgi:hypothetical protein